MQESPCLATARIPHKRTEPDETKDTPLLNPTTLTGVDLETVEPSPSCKQNTA